jgi:hypothetical protein
VANGHDSFSRLGYWRWLGPETTGAHALVVDSRARPAAQPETAYTAINPEAHAPERSVQYVVADVCSGCA